MLFVLKIFGGGKCLLILYMIFSSRCPKDDKISKKEKTGNTVFIASDSNGPYKSSSQANIRNFGLSIISACCMSAYSESTLVFVQA